MFGFGPQAWPVKSTLRPRLRGHSSAWDEGRMMPGPEGLCISLQF